MEKYDNSGILFINDKKETEKHPDFKGNATIGGVEFWVSAWKKKGKNANFLGLSFQPKDNKPKTEEPSDEMNF